MTAMGIQQQAHEVQELIEASRSVMQMGGLSIFQRSNKR